MLKIIYTFYVRVYADTFPIKHIITLLINNNARDV